MRSDLPDIIRTAREAGAKYVQLNTNGIRLAADMNYVRRLQAAGLSAVFLQFDGFADEIYRALRGRALLDQKLQAIKNSGEAGLGVVLVPTLVKGVNTTAVGAILRHALQLSPTVRGVHFQPVSYFGRYPELGGDKSRFTLPELMSCLEEQTMGLVMVKDFSPPGGEHEHCSFHASYVLSGEGQLRALGAASTGGCCSVSPSSDGIKKTVENVERRWKLQTAAPSAEKACCGGVKPDITRAEGPLDLDDFLRELASRSFTVSAMAFQDAENLDLERLRGCCISVISADGRLIPFCACNLTSREGRNLYPIRQGSVPK